MSTLLATNGRLLYVVCKRALRESNIFFQLDHPSAVLVWCDTVHVEYFHAMQPWQVINRLPWAKNMCRKVPFVSLIQRAAGYFPDLIDFLPRSYILPRQMDEFRQAVDGQRAVHIYKPDRGSLGHGIRLIPLGDNFEKLGLRPRLAVAQEYIESVLIDDRKFDLRIYALVASVKPLRIYVYRQGVARFCTETADGNTTFAVLTNTAVNLKNPDAVLEKMTRSVTDVFEQLRIEHNCDIERLWERIENAIGLTIIAGYGFLAKAEAEECPSVGYPRCFQVIGCDVLLDRDLNPYVLEINYRPSMKSSTDQARDTKFAMLRDALKLGCPYQPLQALLNANPDFPTDPAGFREFIAEHADVIEECEAIRRTNEVGNDFHLVYPDIRRKRWDDVLRHVQEMPTEVTMADKLPMALGRPKQWLAFRMPVLGSAKRGSEIHD
jgi:hypothetical protein